MKHNLFLGVLLSLLSALAYSFQTALVKAFTVTMPPLPVVIFIQSLVSLLLLLPVILKKGPQQAKALLSTKRIGLHGWRAVFGLSISYLLFYSVTFIPLVNGLLLANTAPLIIPFIGFLFLSQKINHGLWLPILIGFTGVAIVLNPDSSLFHPASFLAIAAAVSMSLSMLTVRRLATTEATEATLFYFFLFSTLLSGLISLPFWQAVSLPMWPIMAAIGALYFTTQYASTSALKYVNAQLVGSLYYANIIYATIISFFIWNTLPSTATLWGTALIITGGILCIRAEHAANIRTLHLRKIELQYAKEN